MWHTMIRSARLHRSCQCQQRCNWYCTCATARHMQPGTFVSAWVTLLRSCRQLSETDGAFVAVAKTVVVFEGFDSVKKGETIYVGKRDESSQKAFLKLLVTSSYQLEYVTYGWFFWILVWHICRLPFHWRKNDSESSQRATSTGRLYKLHGWKQNGVPRF